MLRAAPVLSLSLFCLAVVTVAGCKKPEDAQAAAAKKAPAAPPVKLPMLTVTEQPTPEVLVLTGTVAADQRAEVTADTAGKVINVMVERGQRVKLGQAVVSLDVRSAALSQQEAAANLSAAKVQRQNAEDECARAKSLLDKGAITKSDWDKQNTACQAALAQVTAAEARVGMMQKSVTDGIVRAPFDGLVGEKDVVPGEWVTPGKPLFTLVDDNPLRINLSVPEVAVRAVSLGEPVSLQTVAFPDKQYSAKVTRMGVEIGSDRALTVEATLDPGSPLLPGMFAEAHIKIGESPHAVLPADAVVKRGKVWHAFVDAKGELEDHIVQLGEPPGPGQVSILQGVVKGDKVVAKVTDAVVDGLKVTE
jgi:membrane fusion protein (multidrug efflux system)